MTVALARRLVWEGIATPEQVNAALYAHVTERTAFLQALLRSHPVLAARLEVELGASREHGAREVVPDTELLRSLPQGMANALLAVPVGRDPATSTVYVLAADASDGHVAAEFAHHFRAPVEIAHAPLLAILSALGPEIVEPDPRTMTPAFGMPQRPVSLAPTRSIVPAPSVDVTRPSDRPIPLTRLSGEAAHAPSTVKGVAPQAVGEHHASRVVVPPRQSPKASEPVIQLTRTKSIVTPPPSPRASVVPEASAATPSSARNDVEAALEALERAASPEEVITALIQGLSGVAALVLVLAVRGKVFEGRDASDDAARQAVRSLVISGDRPSVLQTAVQTGGYTGPVPQTLVHTDLARILGDPTDEIAVGVVTVSGRAALVYVMTSLETAYLATRRGDQLAQAATRALERIVRQRKK